MAMRNQKNLAEFLWRLLNVAKEQLPHILNLIRRPLLQAKKRYSGGTMAILGPPKAGKTTFYQVLRNPQIPTKEIEKYQKTERSEVKSFVCKWKVSVSDDYQVDFKFKVRKTIDIGGEEYIREQHWVDAIKDVSVILYVVDIQSIFNKDGIVKDEAQDRVMRDFDWLFNNSQLPKANFALILVLNKIDLVCKRDEFDRFYELYGPRADELVNVLRKRWKPALRNNLKGAAFVSLLDVTLRNWTFNDVILHLVGEDLYELYKSGRTAA